MKDFDRLFLGFGKLCQDFDSLCQDCVTLFGARWILNNFASEDQLIIGNGANQRNEKFTVNKICQFIMFNCATEHSDFYAFKCFYYLSFYYSSIILKT